MSRLKKSAGLAAVAIAIVGGFEGLRTVAYRDQVNIPTICFGETRGVQMGDRTCIWHYTHLRAGAVLGDDCMVAGR